MGEMFWTILTWSFGHIPFYLPTWHNPVLRKPGKLELRPENMEFPRKLVSERISRFKSGRRRSS